MFVSFAPYLSRYGDGAHGQRPATTLKREVNRQGEGGPSCMYRLI